MGNHAPWVHRLTNHVLAKRYMKDQPTQMLLIEENKNLISFASHMLNLQNKAFLNGLDKLNARKGNTVKSSDIVRIFLFVSVKGTNSCSICARLTSSKDK